MDKDVNIDNYDFDEILDIFKIETFDETTIEEVNKKCSKAKEKHPESIYTFLKKAQKIVECIYLLFQENIIFSLDDLDTINVYVEKIKKIGSFEKYDERKIMNEFLNIETYKKDKNVVFIEPNYNTGQGRVNPNLNNKNITNNIINTYPNTATPGNLNSLKRITQSQNLNLNSCFRNNYYTSSSTDFQYLLPSEIKNVISLRLASIEIPNAWYLFSHKQKNNVFDIKICVDKNITNYTIVIPDGNYDNDSLEEYLNTTYFCDSNLESYLKYLRFSIDKKNFKTRFEILEEHEEFCNFQFSLYFLQSENENMMNTAGWLLGFRLPSYESITENIQSEGLFDGSGDKYIYVSLTDYQYNTNSTNIVGFDKSFMDEDILAKIPMTNGKLSIVIDDNNNPLTKKRVYNGPVNIRKLHIKIFDKFGNIIDLNNMDLSLTLEMEILYESFNFKDVTS